MVGIAEAWKAGRKGFGGGVDLLAKRSEEKREAKRRAEDAAIRKKEREYEKAEERAYQEQREISREERAAPEKAQQMAIRKKAADTAAYRAVIEEAKLRHRIASPKVSQAKTTTSKSKKVGISKIR
jgi:hypothetical protein